MRQMIEALSEMATRAFLLKCIFRFLEATPLNKKHSHLLLNRLTIWHMVIVQLCLLVLGRGQGLFLRSDSLGEFPVPDSTGGRRRGGERETHKERKLGTGFSPP